jgi:CheY-like chemotaxis protein
MEHLVLVVDDDRDIRDSLIETLEDHGYQASGASNGAEALALLRTSPRPCLILLDLMMPVMDGRGFREEQLKNPAWADIPVVVISAYSNVEAQAQELATAFVRKPVSTRPLIDVVRRYCCAGARPEGDGSTSPSIA